MARLIDAERLLKELQTKFDRAERDAEFTGNREIRIGWDDAICAIKQADTVDAEPVRHGRWIMKSDPYGFFDKIPVCSECGCTTKMSCRHGWKL